MFSWVTFGNIKVIKLNAHLIEQPICILTRINEGATEYVSSF